MKIKTKSAGGKSAAKVVPPAEQPEGNNGKVPLNLLADHDELPPMRKLKEEHVEELRESIRRNGLDVPVIVWDGGDPENQMVVPGIKEPQPASFLVAGYHRREALNRLQKEDNAWFKKTFGEGVPVVFRSGTLQEAVTAQLRENVDRENPDTAQVLKQVNRLIKEFKMKPSEVAKAIGKSKTWVSRVMDIEKQLGKGAHKAVEEGELGLQETVEAAAEVKRGKKKGLKIDPKKVVKTLKIKSAGKKAKGKKRAAKGMTAKGVYKAFIALPAMKMGAQLEVAKAALAYLAGEGKLPKELQGEE